VHDDATGTLTVHFADGTVYDYPNVPYEKFVGATQTSSPGQYFHRQIKSQHKGTKRA
jgi:hypothetical protein